LRQGHSADWKPVLWWWCAGRAWKIAESEFLISVELREEKEKKSNRSPLPNVFKRTETLGTQVDEVWGREDKGVPRREYPYLADNKAPST